VLADKGYIAILDFLPPFAYSNVYQHRESLHSFKMDYSRMFLWNPTYILVGLSTNTHKGPAGRSNPDERLGALFLNKNSDSAYPPNPFKS
jgi:hypothetical protein